MTPSLLLVAHLLAPAEMPGAGDAPLRWVAEDPRCPGASQVVDAVVDLAGRWPSRDELQVEAFVQPHDGHWRLTLTMVVGERVHRQELDAQSCPALARAAALIVAVSIDPVRSASVAQVSLVPEIAAPEAAARLDPPPRTEAHEPPAAPPRRVAPFVAAGWELVTGMTPTLSSGPTLAVGLTLDHAQLELMGRYVLPQSTTEAKGEARIHAGVVAGRACLATGPRKVRGLLCAGLEAGALRAQGQRVANARTQHFPWLAGLVRGGVRWRLAPRWALAADVEGSVSAFDAQVVTGDASDADAPRLFETPRIGVRGLLGLELSISRP